MSEEKRKSRPELGVPPQSDERELTEEEERERAEDFARGDEDSSDEMSSVEEELLERGMHIEEPPDMKERQPVAGGARRGEPLRLSEEEDDFEDGRSSGGLYSRLELDRWDRGEQGSKRQSARMGIQSVEGEGEPDTAAASDAPIGRRSPGTGPLVEPGMRRPKRAGRKTRAKTKSRSSSARSKSQARAGGRPRR